MERVIAVVGATATGKSSLAMRLAEALDGEIINADALQVYRGFDIGTAKPTIAEQERVKHHLIDILDPDEPYSAGAFARLARRAIDEIQGRGGTPLVVGGSGLYLKALLSGISPLPPVDQEVRTFFARRLETEGLPTLYAELGRRDPPTAARLAPADRQRILRALEVVESSGRPLSSWLEEKPFGEGAIDADRIGLTLPRTLLYDRIANRVREMLGRGWIAEVRAMLERGVAPEAPAFQAIGYRQIVAHLKGEWSLDTAIDHTIRATRRFAKRQETWFRKETGIVWFPATEVSGDITSLLRTLRSRRGRLTQ